jgi:hypothetical protein
LERNKYYEEYVGEFNASLNNIMKYFDEIRIEDLNYQKRWVEIINSIKTIK